MSALWNVLGAFLALAALWCLILFAAALVLAVLDHWKAV